MSKFKDLVNYCLNCTVKPCRKGCPLENDIPKFIKLAKDGDFLEAFSVLGETTVLSSICGRICPFDRQCEGNCVRRLKGEPVQIGKIEAIIGDKAIQEDYPIFRNMKEINGKKIAIVGAGPAGLTCAAFLKKLGYSVTIYEKYDYLGGIISHGIPDFRLDKDITLKNLNRIVDLGIEVKYNFELGKNITLKELKKEYDAVFLAFGANVSNMPQIKGKNLSNVYGANELLESKKALDLKNKNVIVVGGGDVAMDMARTAKRWGGNVLVVYRRDENKMKADINQINLAKEEKVELLFNTNVKQIIKKENISKAYLVTNDGFKFIYPCDYVFFAIGSKPNERINKKLGLKLDVDGYIKTDKKQMTSMKGVFAGGDLTGTERTVAYAARSGREAAYNIDLYLTKR
ncbi:MAG TPA: FAD-dependent oxidoreductase [Candidatus Onthocola stercorigallinarum]|nr:FAD-dependent oxidoreductase [Candidatus Onthocola stercorigallinarum]